MLVSMTEECRTERETRRVMREREMIELGWPVRDGCLSHPSPSFSRMSKTSSGCLVRLSSLSFFSCLQEKHKKTPQSSVHVQQRRRLETELLNMQVPSYCSFQCSKVDNVPDISIFSKLHLLADVSLSTTLKSRCLINADETKISYTHKHILTQPSCETFQRKYPTQRQIKGGEVYF